MNVIQRLVDNLILGGQCQLLSETVIQQLKVIAEFRREIELLSEAVAQQLEVTAESQREIQYFTNLLNTAQIDQQAIEKTADKALQRVDELEGKVENLEGAIADLEVGQ